MKYPVIAEQDESRQLAMIDETLGIVMIVQDGVPWGEYSNIDSVVKMGYWELVEPRGEVDLDLPPLTEDIRKQLTRKGFWEPGFEEKGSLIDDRR